MTWTTREIEEAWHLWRVEIGRTDDFDMELDNRIEPFLKLNAAGPCLRDMREGSVWTLRDLAQRLGIRLAGSSIKSCPTFSGRDNGS